MQGFLPYCGIGLNQDSCKYADSNHNPGELSSPISNEKNREAYFSGIFYLVVMGNLARKSSGYIWNT
jgi:hypothetical protein